MTQASAQGQFAQGGAAGEPPAPRQFAPRQDAQRQGAHGAKMRDCAGRAAAIAAWALSAWPLWTWWTRRLAEPIDADVAAWCVFALFAAELWVRKGRAAMARPLTAWKLVFAAFCLAAFHVARLHLPPTASGVFAVMAGLPLLLPDDTEQGPLPPPLVALALMGLPSTLIAKLFFGFPLRILATRLAAGLLRAAHLPVERWGVELSIGDVSVLVDTPCDGVRMLGTGLLLAFALAQVFRFRAGRTILLAAGGVCAVILANVARISVLTLLMAEGLTPSHAAHEAMGAFALLPGAAACAGLAFLLARKKRRAAKSAPGEAPANAGAASAGAPDASAGGCADASNAGSAASCACAAWKRRAATALFLLAAAGVSLTKPDPVAPETADFPGWPETFEGKPLVETRQLENEVRFAANFPGRIARFRAGGEIVILRWTDRATYRVHPLSVCLRAHGWSISPLPMERRADGDWSAFQARKGDETLTVREQVRAADGSTFADVSGWFWNAQTGRTAGPWLILSVAGRPR